MAEFNEKIVRPYYNANLNAAFQDLINKALAGQDFVLLLFYAAVSDISCSSISVFSGFDGAFAVFC